MPNPDRRTARSHRALLAAFIELLLEHGYGAVSVADIAARADLGRSTFYMHFTGKDDILRQALTWPCSGLAALVTGEVRAEAAIPLLEHFREQRKRNRAFFVEPIRALWVRNLAGFIETKLRARARTGGVPALPLDLAAIMIAEAQVGLLAQWLTARSPLPAAAVAQALVAASEAQAAALLGHKSWTAA